MKELFVFCSPGNAYKGLSEQEVAKAYTQMAIDDYDNLVSFDESYIPFLETPDLVKHWGVKSGRNLLLTVFSEQPVLSVGKVIDSFTSTSYLFNPAYSIDELLLPDLDIVQLKGTSQVHDAANAIKQFYDSYGWNTYVSDEKITERVAVNPTSDRLDQSILMVHPNTLRVIAKDTVGYNFNKLSF